jgi:WD40 repeat protein/tRNA A-37 threonylcarbamoyl transferase component Bud32
MGDEQHLDEVITAYLKAVEAGVPIDQAQWLKRYPDLAADLAEYFTDRASVERAAAPFRGPGDSPTGPALPVSADEGPIEPGRQIRYFGDYELLEEIARGGMGVVYKARQVKLRRVVAVKMILAGELATATDVERFRTEARAAANLHHPHIVAIHEIGQHQGQHYFSMDYVAGESLASRIARGPLPAREAAALLQKVAEAVAFAHVEGVVHRDLKPANILLDADHQPHVTDFGLAKRVQGEPGASATGGPATGGPTETGQVLGTPSYMPPEQAAGKTREIGPCSDVYSLGAVLYCTLTGRPPFQAAGTLDTLLQVLEREPVPPRALNPAVPRDLETICLKCLRKEPGKRYASARELAQELERFLDGKPIRARRIGAVGRTWRWCRRQPALAGAGALALVAVAATVVLSIRFAVYQTRAAERTQRLLAESYLDRGQSLCDQGDTARGLLWLGRSLGAAPAGAADLQQLIRTNLSAWAPPTPRIRKVFKHSEGVGVVRFSGNGRIILTAERRGYGSPTARLWDVATGQPIGVPIAYKGIKDVDLSPDGTMLATGQGDDSRWDAQIWDTKTGKLIRNIPLPKGSWFGTSGNLAARVKFSPDGKTLFTPNGRLADVATGKPVFAKRIGKRFSQFECAGFSQDGKRIVTALFGGQAYVWDLATGKPVGPPVPWAVAVALNSDGTTLLAGGSDGTARLWDVGTGKPKGALLRHRRGQRRYEIQAVSLSPDGTLALTALGDRTVRLWDAAAGVPIGLPLPHLDSVADLAFSPDGKSFLTGSGSYDKTARLWDVPDRQPAEILLPHTHAKIHQLAFSPDSKLLASASGLRGAVKIFRNAGTDIDQMGQVHFWDRATGKLLGKLSLNEGPVYAMAFSPDGTTLAAFTRYADMGRGGGLVQFIDVARRKIAGPPLVCKEHGISELSFGPDGKTLTTTDGFWQGPGGKTNAGKRAVKTWDLATRTVLRQTVAQEDYAWFRSADRRWKVAGDYDFTAVITGPGSVRGQIQHEAAVVSAAFSPDGTLLLTGSQDNTARLWHLPTFKPIGPLIRHQKYVTAVAFSPDGQAIATGSEDGLVRLAPVPAPIGGDPEHIDRWLEALTGASLDGLVFRPLTADTWLQRLNHLAN